MNQHSIELNKKNLREFGLISGAIVAVLFGLFIPWLFNKPWPLWPWYITGVLAVLALLLPMVLVPVYKIWMKFGLVMGFINTRIILGIVFYLVFTPVAFILKILRKDPMQRKLKKDSQSYRVKSIDNDINHMENPY